MWIYQKRSAVHDSFAYLVDIPIWALIQDHDVALLRSYHLATSQIHILFPVRVITIWALNHIENMIIDPVANMRQ